MRHSVLTDDHDPLLLPLCAIGSRAAQTGEQRLMLAVLCDAMHAYAADQARRKRPVRVIELRQWFDSTDRSYVSFESVCDALGLDPTYVRHRVLGRRPIARRPWAHRVHSHRIVAPRIRVMPTRVAGRLPATRVGAGREY